MQLSGVVRNIGDWVNELQWATAILQKKCFLSSLLRLAWCAVIYGFWKESNSRVHDNQ